MIAYVDPQITNPRPHPSQYPPESTGMSSRNHDPGLMTLVIGWTPIDEEFFTTDERGPRTNRREGSGGRRGDTIPELVEDFPACTDFAI
jgi:hypothetical protein